MHFASESHDGSNLALLTRRKHRDLRHVLFSVLHVPFFYKHSTNNAPTSNKYVGRKSMYLNYHGLLWAEMAMRRIDLLFAAKIFDSQ